MSTESLNTISTQIILPGPALKKAREAKGLTVEEMAAISNLTKQVIRGIESDSYDELAGLSFVRGYLKLYAKKLGVDEASILEPFDAWKREQSGDPAAAPHLKGFENHPAGGQSNTGTRGVLWVGVGVLVALLATGFYISMQEGAAPTTAEQDQPSVSPTVADLPYPTEEQPLASDGTPVDDEGAENTLSESAQISGEATNESESSEETLVGSEASGSVTADSTARGEGVPDAASSSGLPESAATETPEPPALTEPPVQEPPPAPAPVEAVAAPPKPPAVERPTPPVQNVALPKPPEVAAPVVDAPPPPRLPRAERVLAEAQNLQPASPQPTENRIDNRDQDAGLRVLSETVTGAIREREQLGAPGRLQMRFTGESWVEVRDAQGRLILADLMRAERDVSLDTWGPIEVLVGAVDVSTIVFNGETLDLSNRAYQNVARVTLGAARN